MNCIELFAGAGGLMLGLDQAGMNTLLATEVHPDPCKTLARNFPDTPIVCEDIRSLSGKDLLRKAGLRANCHIDLIAGGPPCQGFSTAGLKDPEDPRNTLVGDYIRIVRDLKPDFFVLENVVGLTSMYGGKLFARVQEMLDELDYQFHWKIVHAADYGVPQMRKRFILIGSRSQALPQFPEPTHFDPKKMESDLLSSNEKTFVTCGDAIGDLPEIGQGEIADKYDRKPSTLFQKKMRKNSRRIYNHQASKHRDETMNYYSLVPAGGTWLDIPEEKRKKKQGMQRWPLDGLARTITTEPTDFLHPNLNRIPTIRELARIQTFPDKYEFLGQRTTGNKMRRLGYCAQSQQVGNAVPPLMAQAIGEAIIAST